MRRPKAVDAGGRFAIASSACFVTAARFSPAHDVSFREPGPPGFELLCFRFYGAPAL